MRRIVHYYPGAMGDSGVTFALWSWARAQAAAGAEVCVLHADESRCEPRVGFVTKDIGPGLSARCVPHAGSRRLTLRPLALERHLGADDLLVLHEGWVTGNLAAGEAARRAGVPYVVMPHGVYERAWTRYLKPPRWLRHRLERRLLEGAAAVHVFFDSEIDDIRALAPGARFVTVPTGFDLPAREWAGGGGYLAWVGRIDPMHKGLDTLTAAIAALPPDARPVVRIRGYDYKGGTARLQRLIEEHGVERWMRVEGPIVGAAKQDFLREADGYVHPSRWECHSMALLENLALGVPCLVSRAIHIAPALERSDAAVLTEPRERAIARGLSSLPALGQRVAARGRALVGRAFGWSTLIPRYRAALAHEGLL